MGDERRRRRQKMVGRRGGEQQQRDVAAIDARACERHFAGLDRDVGKCLAVGRIAARFNAGPAFDPARLEAKPAFDLGVCYNFLGRVVAKSDDLDAGHVLTSSTASARFW